jgi:hypothetical protein
VCVCVSMLRLFSGRCTQGDRDGEGDTGWSRGISLSTAFGRHLAGLLLEAEKAAAAALWLCSERPGARGQQQRAPQPKLPPPALQAAAAAYCTSRLDLGEGTTTCVFRWSGHGTKDLRDKSLVFGLARNQHPSPSMEMTAGLGHGPLLARACSVAM